MQIRIDVETAAGTRLGYGPIMTATGWKVTPRLDRAGDFSFQMPMADPQYATLITRRNYVRCWQLIDGAMTEIGLGIVDTVDEDSNADPSMATVSGSNIMRELTWRSVKGLLISEPGNVSPDDVHRVTLDSSGSGAEASPNNYLVLTNAFDGNLATWYDLNVTGGFQYVYLGYSRVFSQVAWIFNQVNQTVVNSVTTVQYYDGSGWVNLTYTDGTSTIVGGQNICFGQNGSWTFTPPADWVPLLQNCAATGDPVNNKTDYWLRFHLTGWAWDHVKIAEILILTEVPTVTGPQLIMALAPSGWTLTGTHTATLTSVYLQLADETVLEALNTLASITGEHFRLSGTASSREIEWLQIDTTDSGVTAFRNGDPSSVADNPAACLIQRLKTTHDSIDMVSRVIPYGAGQAGARTTLQYTTRSAPAGYTLDAVNNYIKYTAGEAAYGQVERVMSWPNIGPASAATADLAPASDALFDQAIYWLSTHSTVVDSYALTVYGLTTLIKVGDTIRVVWLEVVDGVAIRNVDANLIILEAAYTLDQDGTYSAALLVSNLARWPLSETDAIAKLMGNVRSMSSISQSASIGTMSTPNLAVSVKSTASGFGGLNFGG